MSRFDGNQLIDVKAAAREYDVPVMALEISIRRGVLRLMDVEGVQLLSRNDIEQWVTKTVKRGAGNTVVSPIRKS
jgi:hypothetical protein